MAGSINDIDSIIVKVENKSKRNATRLDCNSPFLFVFAVIHEADSSELL